MKRLILVVGALMMASPVSAAQYYFVFKDGGNAYSAFGDPARIKDVGGLRTAWLDFIYNPKVPNEYGARTGKIKLEADCNHNTISIPALYLYNDAGVVVHQDEGFSPQTEPVPDSNGELDYKFICDATTHTEQSSVPAEIDDPEKLKSYGVMVTQIMADGEAKAARKK